MAQLRFFQGAKSKDIKLNDCMFREQLQIMSPPIYVYPLEVPQFEDELTDENSYDRMQINSMDDFNELVESDKIDRLNQRIYKKTLGLPVRAYATFQKPAWSSDMELWGYETKDDSLEFTFSISQCEESLGRKIHEGDVIRLYEDFSYRQSRFYAVTRVLPSTDRIMFVNLALSVIGAAVDLQDYEFPENDGLSETPEDYVE